MSEPEATPQAGKTCAHHNIIGYHNGARVCGDCGMVFTIQQPPAPPATSSEATPQAQPEEAGARMQCPNGRDHDVRYKRGDGNAWCHTCGFFPIAPPATSPDKQTERCVTCGHSRKVHIGGLACGNKVPQCACERFAQPAPSPDKQPERCSGFCPSCGNHAPPAPSSAGTVTRATPCKKCGLSLSQHVLAYTLDDMVTLEPNWCGSVIPLLDALAAKDAEIAALREEVERLDRLHNEACDEVVKLVDRELNEKARADRLLKIIEEAPHERWCKCVCGPGEDTWTDETKGCDCFKSKALTFDDSGSIV